MWLICICGTRTFPHRLSGELLRPLQVDFREKLMKCKTGRSGQCKCEEVYWNSGYRQHAILSACCSTVHITQLNPTSRTRYCSFKRYEIRPTKFLNLDTFRHSESRICETQNWSHLLNHNVSYLPRSVSVLKWMV